MIQAKILKELLIDGRKSTGEIAKEIGETKKTVNRHYQEMKLQGIIQGATLHVNYKKFGYKAVAHILITVDPKQADGLIEYAGKKPETYAVYGFGSKGNVRIVSILKTLQQLDEIKDAIKQQFSISSLRTTIWTDVKEMHGNLALEPQKKTTIEKANASTKGQKTSNIQEKKIVIDEIDEKIVEKLSENGRSPFGKIGQEIGISADTAKRRYQKLKNNGFIKVTIQIDPAKIGYQAMVLLFVIVTLQENSFSIIEKIRRVPDVISIMKTSGDYDLQVYVLVRDLNQLLTVQDDIGNIQGINRMDIEINRIPNKWPTPRQYMSTF